MKLGMTTVLSVLGMALNVAAAIVGGIASEQKNKEILAKLVDEKLGNK